MKTVFLFSICLLLARLAAAADLNFSLTALNAGTTTNRVIVVRPEWQNPTNTIGLADATLLRTGTNSSVTLSNVPEAILNVEIMAPPARTVFSIYVPDTNGTLNVADLRGLGTGGKLDPNKYSWSVRASDARYAQIGAANVNLLATGTNVFYVENFGNDTNSGTVYAPLLTLTNALSRISAGGIIHVGPGIFAVPSISISNVCILGSGRLSTIFSNNITGNIITIGNNVWLANFTLLNTNRISSQFAYEYTTTAAGATNVYCANLDMIGGSDNLVTGNLTNVFNSVWENCRFFNMYDGINIRGSSLATNSVNIFRNCLISSQAGQNPEFYSICRGAVVSVGLASFVGCHFISKNATSWNGGLYVTYLGSAQVAGCLFDCTSTNSPSFSADVLLDSGTVVNLDASTTNVRNIDGTGMVNFTGDNRYALISSLGTAAYSNFEDFAPSSVTNLTDAQLANIKFAVTNSTLTTAANSGLTNNITVSGNKLTGTIGISALTTNLQLTFNSVTNTLYFTNGILKRVTQP